MSRADEAVGVVGSPGLRVLNDFSDDCKDGTVLPAVGSLTEGSLGNGSWKVFMLAKKPNHKPN